MEGGYMLVSKTWYTVTEFGEWHSCLGCTTTDCLILFASCLGQQEAEVDPSSSSDELESELLETLTPLGQTRSTSSAVPDVQNTCTFYATCPGRTRYCLVILVRGP